MARTRLFSAMKQVLVAAGQSGIDSQCTMARRDVLRFSAATAGVLAAHAIAGDTVAQSVATVSGSKIAIIGGGAAGLTAAYRLQAAGLSPKLFEAANRWGGRIFTRSDFYHGMFCELGGELVDTGHSALRQIVEELGLELEPIINPEDRERDLYFFGGQLRSVKDMLDPERGGGAFVPIARQIGLDKAQLRDRNGEYSDNARRLDNISLYDYVKQFKGKTDDWAIDLIIMAYTIEFGLPVQDQSSLNLIDYIGTAIKEPFQMFGDSDEAFRIKNGSSTLINALVQRCQSNCKLTLGAPLKALSRGDRGIEVTVASPNGDTAEVFDIVILALPFTRLRLVDGIDHLGLSSDKLIAIRELGYGNHAKIMCGTRTRSWRDGDNGLPLPSNGTFYSDLAFQVIWETSRAQPGQQGILTNLLAGNSMPSKQDVAVDNLHKGLAALSPKIGASLDVDSAIAFFWERHPFTLGSYSSAKVGQYTGVVPSANKPECDGRLHFAGEHTEPEFVGYMNGAIASGNRAANAILIRLGLKMLRAVPE
jgi:monoamine oxidase